MTEAQIRILELFASFISGGLVVGLVEWYRAHRSGQLERRLQLTRDSLGKLYGPIHFFTAQNQECFRVCDLFHKALHSDRTHAVDKNGNRHSLLTTEEMKDTIDLSNDYIEVVKRNNDQIVDIFRQNWMLVEPQDIDLFRQMIVDHTRLKVEVPEDGKGKMPLLVYPEIGPISFMRREFIDRIDQRVREKQVFLKESAGIKSRRTMGASVP
jgi:hypothetical protein